MEKHTPWRKEPMVWLLIALPLSAVIGGALTIWFAANNADTLVSEAHRKEGMATYQVHDADRQAVELGAEAHLLIQGELLTVHLGGRFATPPASLTLALIHPTEANADLQLTLLPAADGTYQGPLPSLAEGRRRLILSPASGGWQLTGEWSAPFTGELRLRAGQPNSSTSP